MRAKLSSSTCNFTKDARKEATRDGVPPIELVDGERLVLLFEELRLGLIPRQTYDVDMDFFKQFAQGQPVPSQIAPTSCTSEPGTMLTREYNGRTYRVKRLAQGFEYEGKVYNSLTAVAKLITGYKAISGPMFFQAALGKEGD